jgi:hypothetical protein
VGPSLKKLNGIVHLDHLPTGFRPARAETQPTQGSADIFNGNKPLNNVGIRQSHCLIPFQKRPTEGRFWILTN